MQGFAMLMGDNWVEVQNCAWLHEAQFLASVLESEGIEYQIPDEYTIGVHPGIAAALGGIRILVRAGDLERARTLLNSAAGPHVQDDEPR